MNHKPYLNLPIITCECLTLKMEELLVNKNKWIIMDMCTTH